MQPSGNTATVIMLMTGLLHRNIGQREDRFGGLRGYQARDSVGACSNHSGRQGKHLLDNIA
jgi:hypothetical protein